MQVARASGVRAIAKSECRSWDVAYGNTTLIPKQRARARKRHHGGRTQYLSLERQEDHTVPEPGEARGPYSA